MQLRPYQKKCVESVIAAAKKGVTRQLIVLPTGCGKTVIFSQFPPLVRDKGKKTLILAHREELLFQAKEKLAKVDSSLKVGIEQGDSHVIGDEDVVIASVPTLGREGSKRIQKFNPEEFGMIIADECHHFTNLSSSRILEYFDVLKGKIRKPSGRILLGVTATPTRSDKVGLDKIFDKIVFTYQLREAIDSGYLSNIEAYSVETQEDISSVKTIQGDFSDGELSKIVNTPRRNRLIVESYEHLAKDSKALVFAVDVKHTIDLTEMFQNCGYKAEHVLGSTKREERRDIIKKFDKGEISVLINCMVATEGFDVPSIETILMARPTKSSVLYQQIIGRGLRIFEGKENLKLIDFVDTVGKNSIMMIPNLFGINKKLKGINGKKITEVVDQVEKIFEVNPDYDVEVITDWEKESIEKVIKRVDVFSQAELPNEIKQNSNFAWVRYKEGYRLQFPVRDEEELKQVLIIEPNLLDRFTLKMESWEKTIPIYENSFKKWCRIEETIIDERSFLPEIIQCGDDWILQNKPQYTTMFSQNSKWRKDEPTEKQIQLMRKLGIAIPKGITKGQCSNLISKALATQN